MSTGKPPERQSLMFRDLTTPISSQRRGAGGSATRKFATPGKSAAVSGPWWENFDSASDLPPPPVFTLDDRPDFSPGPSLIHHSPSPPTAPPLPPRGEASPFPFSALSPNKPRGSPASAHAAEQLSSGWRMTQRSEAQRSEADEERGKGGSPMDGVVPTVALVTLPPPREVVRPEIKMNSFPDIGITVTEQWVTVYGFPLGDTNLVLREFEKCGFISKCVPGPGDANWMHILYENHYDAQKALRKHGMQINSLLMIGVKPFDPAQGRFLDGKFPGSSDGSLLALSPSQNLAGKVLPGPCRSGFIQGPHHLPNGNAAGSGAQHQQSREIASPKPKSIVSRVLHLMFGTS